MFWLLNDHLFWQICVYLSQGGWTSERDPDQKAIYSYTDRLWVGYDDLESIALKVKWAKIHLSSTSVQNVNNPQSSYSKDR